MDSFFRFPHTPHLTWLGSAMPRGDKLLTSSDRRQLLSGEVTIEEKMDGANLGFSIDANGHLRIQNRGSFLSEPYGGQFHPLSSWLQRSEERLFDALTSEADTSLVIFGEWCAALHSIPYRRLPDLWLVFDVYDHSDKQFWSTQRRNALCRSAGFSVVPHVATGHFSATAIEALLSARTSAYGDTAAEGLVVRRESDLWTEQRAKIVRADFTQAIQEHWSSRAIVWNSLDRTVGIND